MRFGEFTFDRDARLLFCGDREVHLSRKAFDLLSALLERRGVVVSRQELYAQLWGDNTHVESSNIDNLISEIRKALADPSQSPRFIKTIHGVGYRFFAPVETLRVERPRSGARPQRCLIWNDRTIPLAAGSHRIGRDSACDVCVDADTVSRDHARITLEAGGDTAILEDVHSTNGTFHGQTRLKAGDKHRLSDGDVFRLGEETLTFHTYKEQKTRRVVGGE